MWAAQAHLPRAEARRVPQLRKQMLHHHGEIEERMAAHRLLAKVQNVRLIYLGRLANQHRVRLLQAPSGCQFQDSTILPIIFKAVSKKENSQKQLCELSGSPEGRDVY
jgi:hypothetical protein